MPFILCPYAEQAMIAEINGIHLNYEETGKGRVMLFLHGNGQNMSMFDGAVKYFKDSYKCVTLDSRGHGKSDWGTEKLTIPLLADDTVRFIEKMDYNDVVVIGFSDGGNIALEAAAVSDRIGTVVAVGANLRPDGLTLYARSMIRLVRALCIPFGFIRSVRNTRRIFYLMSHQPEITAEKLSAIKARTLVTAGTKDYIRTEHTREIAEKIPSASLRLFENADHFLFEKRAEELLGMIGEFVKGTDMRQDTE